MSNFVCSIDSCPVILSSICVIYQGESLIYTGINDGDSLQTALQKIDGAFADAGLGYAFQNGVIQTTPGVPVELGGSLLHDTTIGGNYKLTLAGRIEASALITTGGTSSQFVKGNGTLDSNAYQLAGNYITALTGDGTAVGPGSAALTLATVNANPGTYGTGTLVPRITVDAKGRVTSITTTAIPSVSGILVFEGDVTGSGITGAPVTLTLATVNTNVYSAITFLKFKVNAKGLVTGASPVTNLDIEGALGYVPVPNTRTITINGVTQNLQANRTWTLAVGVASVTASAPLASTGGATPNISITQADGSTNGYLSSTDWNTFNNKQPAGSYVITSRTINTTGPLQGGGDLSVDRTLSITQSGIAADGYLSSTDWNTFNNKQPASHYITDLTGEATGTGPGIATVTLSTPAVTGKVLTGVNITGGTVVATDTILQGFGKLQNQINALIGGSIYQGVWNAATNTPTLTSGVGTDGYYYIVNVAGNTNLNGITNWNVGDWAIFHGGVWQKVDNTDAVISVNSYTGAVSLVSSDIPEGATNLYYTDTRARQAISLTTTGSSGVATYNNTTGIFNIPQYQSVLTNPITGTGTVNYVPKFNTTSSIADSNIQDSGSLITLGSDSYISSGALGIGTSSLTGFNLRISKNITGASNSYGIFQDSTIQSDVTNAYINTSNPSIAPSSTVSSLFHYRAFLPSIGAGSTLTTQYGYSVQSSMVGATANYGFWGNLAAGTGLWNIYMAGSANNYLSGNLLIGSSTDNTYKLQVTGDVDIAKNDRANGAVLRLTNSFNGSGWIAGDIIGSLIFYSSDTSAAANRGAIRSISESGSTNSSATGLSFETYSSAVLSQKMFLTGAGNLLIGSTADNGAKLQVTGTATISSSLGIGNTSLANYNLRITKNITGATTSYAIRQDGIVQSDSINAAYGMRNDMNTAAASFTVAAYSHYYATEGTIGAGSAVTNQYGFTVTSSMTSATNNYGFFGAIAAGTNRWNLYMGGTAQNYLAGALSIGVTTANASALLQVDSTTKGFLPPRMTAAQRTAIASPATGLIVYQTDGVEGVYVNTSIGWKSLTMV